ncbi:putative Oligosaccharyltransferase complex [Monocercomonoides exilis]|uniref:putative Oligosaccharyltransferase complex n=1 Tax=Monocercomonoides exilis TaxID=2049356 RepID=UPI0035597681|nr:putative Oligosaccharyltransferase complex [Monocercomonoides exilis]|eukprot:MONOS_642.1-p1 / transcript=MONOS_642.1 / gene=MONOS_642 / organism=Monocercomonoides_exilis_PA203 / gene_product=Oligosaccharyltransferase complex / transcript_product=Oligosaccharyltransferase complex / location=Mono_scaffold00010:241414-242072(-) / protein_length=149 / sequence_SO=supercontig / SO=protein_coding / is_pseudo=false
MPLSLLPHSVSKPVEKAYTKVFRPPNLRLRFGSLSTPNFYVVVALLTFSAYIIFSGIFYDIINSPPSMGQERDPMTGLVYPVVVHRGGISSQFVLEGFSAGFFYVLAGASFIMIASTNSIVQIVGLVSFVLSYAILSVFMRTKMGDYPF